MQWVLSAETLCHGPFDAKIVPELFRVYKVNACPLVIAEINVRISSLVVNLGESRIDLNRSVAEFDASSGIFIPVYFYPMI